MPEPISREGLCRAPICFRRNDPDFHYCVVCGKPATEHAHVLSRALRPDLKREPDNIICLCNWHHREIDLHHGWHAVVPTLEGGLKYIRGKLGGEVTFEKVLEGNGRVVGDIHSIPDPVGDGLEECEVSNGRSLRGSDARTPETPSHPQGEMGLVLSRALRTRSRDTETIAEGCGDLQDLSAAPEAISEEISDNPLTADWSGKSDDELTMIFQEAERAKSGAFLVMCKCVWQYREKHHRTRGESWVEEAYERFHSSRRTLEGWAGFWEVCASLPDTYADHVGTVSESRDLVQVIGRAEKATKAPVLLEAAVDYVAEYGEPPSKAQLLHKVGVESGERPRTELVCASCGSTDIQRREVQG